MLHSSISASLVLAFALWAPTAPSLSDVHKAESILDRHVEATGGADAYAKHEYRVSVGTVLHDGVNIISSLSIHESRSTDYRRLFRSESMGDQVDGSTGKVAWIYSDISGNWLMRGPALARALREAPLDSPTIWRKQFERVDYAGPREVDGKTLHAVTLVSRDGVQETRTYDADTGLHIQTECETELEGNSIPTVFTYSDYRTVDGVLLPHTIRQEHTGIPGLVINLDRIVHEQELADSLFEPPAPVRALLDR